MSLFVLRLRPDIQQHIIGVRAQFIVFLDTNALNLRSRRFSFSRETRYADQSCRNEKQGKLLNYKDPIFTAVRRCVHLFLFASIQGSSRGNEAHFSIRSLIPQADPRKLTKGCETLRKSEPRYLGCYVRL